LFKDSTFVHDIQVFKDETKNLEDSANGVGSSEQRSSEGEGEWQLKNGNNSDLKPSEQIVQRMTFVHESL
jgi:hypothetical protein